eukprot:2949245-Rhodomonas_salina.1
MQTGITRISRLVARSVDVSSSLIPHRSSSSITDIIKPSIIHHLISGLLRQHQPYQPWVRSRSEVSTQTSCPASSTLLLPVVSSASPILSTSSISSLIPHPSSIIHVIHHLISSIISYHPSSHIQHLLSRDQPCQPSAQCHRASSPRSAASTQTCCPTSPNARGSPLPPAPRVDESALRRLHLSVEG